PPRRPQVGAGGHHSLTATLEYNDRHRSSTATSVMSASVPLKPDAGPGPGPGAPAATAEDADSAAGTGEQRFMSGVVSLTVHRVRRLVGAHTVAPSHNDLHRFRPS